MSTIVKGFLCIVPSTPLCQTTFKGEKGWSDWVRKVLRAFSTLGIQQHSLSPDPESERWIQVHYYSDPTEFDGSDDWTDKGHDAWCDEIGVFLPGSLPLSILEGKKEGDKLIIEGTKYTLDLVCKQSDSCFIDYGTFEEVVAKMANNYVITYR